MSESLGYWSSEGTREKLSQVAVKGAQHDSRERQPHPKCLEGTRVDLLNYIYELLDNQEKSQVIWLHGMAGVGKSAVAFTVAERMRGLKVEEGSKEKRLAGTFFFSRKHTKRRTTGYFFATLAYQIANNFPSIREDVNRAIFANPALLDHDMPLRDQMEALFLRPLRRLQLRLRECPPLTLVVDALDECMPESAESGSVDESASESELADLISLLGEALCEPDLPITHILLTSRSEEHIRKAVRTLGEGVATTISLDDADVDNDIYIFLQHSFTDLQSHHPRFPQPSTDQLARLVRRAGQRFIVASTMMKFIDDRNHDPRSRLQLMLELASEWLPGTAVYTLYDRILFTCADPMKAYLFLSVVAALADPLPMSQISELLGPGQGRDVETVLVQLRSLIDIPTDNSHPVHISHSSVRDYVSNRYNCNLDQVQYTTSAHSLLARSSFNLMMQDIPASTTLLNALSELTVQSQAIQSHDPQMLKNSLAFIVQPPEPLQVLMGLLWLRGDRSSQSWLETMDGHAWLQNQGKDWLKTIEGKDWLDTQGHHWLQTQGGNDWLRTSSGVEWLRTPSGRHWQWTPSGREWLRLQIPYGEEWIQSGQDPLQTWVETESGQEWLQTPHGQEWLQTQSGREWVCTPSGRGWLQTRRGREWLQIPSGRDWLLTAGGREWLQNSSGDWLKTQGGRDWLKTQGGRDWLQNKGGRDWLQTESGQYWLQTPSGRDWLQTQGGRDWLRTQNGQDWLQTPQGQEWRSTLAASVWVTMEEFSSTVETVNAYIIDPQSPLLPAFQAIQKFKSLPDFLMFPVFLALRHHDHSTYSSPQGHFPPGMEVVHAMKAFQSFANKAQERSQSASDALKYACQNWAVHLSRASYPWDDMLKHVFESFWSRHLLSWLEWQWCLKDLRSCLTILYEGEKLLKATRQQTSAQTKQPDGRRRGRTPSPDRDAETTPSPSRTAKRQRTNNFDNRVHHCHHECTALPAASTSSS